MNAEELANAVDELDIRLERLRVLMEQYFQGIEKIPPNVVHKDVERRIWILRREKIRNTGTRFRFQQIIQRYNTFSSYWMRIMREIENGTYKRDVLRAKKRFGPDALKPQLAPAEATPSVELTEDDLTDDDLSDFGDLGPLPTAPKRAPPPPPRPAAPAAAPPAPPPTPAPAPSPVAARPAPTARPSLPKPPPSPAVPQILARKVETDDDLDDMLDAALGPGAQAPKPAPAPQPRPQPAVARPQPSPALRRQPTGSQGDPEFRRVYSEYVEARRRNGESTAGLTYENLAKSLQQTKEKLRDKTAGKKIDFEVSVKDGKTILKPVVR